MKIIKNLIENFRGEICDLCFEILKNAENKEEVFEYTCKHLLQKPKKGKIDIQKYFTKEEKDSYDLVYGSTINALINMSIKKCNLDIISGNMFYVDLWQSYCKNFITDKEQAFAFYYTVINPTIPYQYLGKSISMSDERFKQISEENKSLIKQINYVKRCNLKQRTEDASLILNCLDTIKEREVKVVMLAHAITNLGSREKHMKEDTIESLIQKLDEKIKELEEEEL